MEKRTLYVCRPVLNANEIIEHFKAQDFEKCVQPDDLHCTITYSREPVVWEDMGEDLYQDADGTVTVKAGNDPRSVAPLGNEGAVVLHFVSPVLVARHNEMRRQGASFDYSQYQPHITISYNGEGVDLSNVKPWTGDIVFGPEKFDSLKEDWSSSIEEAAKLNHTDLLPYFINPKRYKKFGSTLARLAKPGEKIDTVIDGKRETTNTAHSGDVVLKGPNGEEYIIKGDKFKSRYKGPALTTEYQAFTPIGEAWAVEWRGGNKSFVAPWGEDMVIHDGDFLVSTNKEGSELYRIERDVFSKTYKPV